MTTSASPASSDWRAARDECLARIDAALDDAWALVDGGGLAPDLRALVERLVLDCEARLLELRRIPDPAFWAAAAGRRPLDLLMEERT